MELEAADTATRRDAVLRWWRASRLDLGPLDPFDRALARAALGTAATSAVGMLVIGVMSSTSVHPPQPTLAGQILAIIAGLTLAVGAAALVASRRTGSTLSERRLTTVVVALLGSLLSLFLVALTDPLAVAGRDLVAAVVAILAVAGLASSVAVLSRATPPHARLAAAAMPFVSFVLVGLMVEPVIRAASRGDAVDRALSDVLEVSIEAVIAVMGFLGIAVLFAWAVLEGVRAGGDASEAVVGASRRIGPRLASIGLIVFLAGKLLWLILGYSGVLPGDAWTRSSRDGLAWLLAIGYGTAFVAWASSRRAPRLSDRGTRKGALLIGAAVVVTASLAATSAAIASALTLIMRASPVRLAAVTALVVLAVQMVLRIRRPEDRRASALRAIVATVSGAIAVWIVTVPSPPSPDPSVPSVVRGAFAVSQWLATNSYLVILPALVFVAIVAGIILLVRAVDLDGRSMGSALIVFGVWALPRAVDALAYRFGRRDDAVLTLLRPEVGSVDAVLTVAVACVALYAWRRRSGRQPVELFTVLFLFTVATRAGDLIPPLSSRLGSILFFGGLVAALAYQFMLDARELNNPDDSRAQRVLWVTGVAAFIFGFSAVGVSSGSIGPDAFEASRLFVAAIIVPPAAVLASALALGRLRGGVAYAEPPAPRTRPRWLPR